MKKLVAILAAAVLAGGSIFAGDFYNGDVQLQLGVGFDEVKIQDINKPVKATVVDFGLETWHLFRPIELVGVGFSVGFNGGLGPTDRWSYPLGGLTEIQGNNDGLSANFNFNIGPAAAIYLGKVVRFGLNLGLNTGINYDMPYFYSGKIKEGNSEKTYNSSISILASYVGINFGLQAKFFPESVVNPVIGWRLSTGSNSEYFASFISSGNSSSSKSSSSDTTYKGKYEFTQNVIYLALSFSW